MSKEVETKAEFNISELQLRLEPRSGFFNSFLDVLRFITLALTGRLFAACFAADKFRYFCGPLF
jgi:hypothetical protein